MVRGVGVWQLGVAANDNRRQAITEGYKKCACENKCGLIAINKKVYSTKQNYMTQKFTHAFDSAVNSSLFVVIFRVSKTRHIV